MTGAPPVDNNLNFIILQECFQIFNIIHIVDFFVATSVIHNIHATELLAIFLVMVICVVNVRITNALLNRYCS